MAYNKVIYGDQTLIDLTSLTAKASDVASGKISIGADGVIFTGTSSGGGLPSGISKIAFGTDTINSDFTTTRRTVTHNLGVVPDMVLYWHDGNVAQTYSMLWALRSTKMGYRSSAYNSFMCYHGNSTTTTTLTNSNSTTYGVSNMTASTFQIASSSTSYYWRAGTYNWVAIKFS